MALLLSAYPKNYSASKNPMKVKMSTDNYLQTAGSVQQVDITDNTPFVAGASLVFTIGNRTITVSVVTTPDPNKMEIRPYTNNTTLQQMVNDLQNLPIIGEYFGVSAVFGTPSTVNFTQILADSGNELTITGWTGATIVNTAASDPVYRPNFKGIINIHTQRYESNDKEFNNIATLGAIPDDLTNMTVDIRKAFSGVLLPDPPADLTTVNATICENMYKFYWFEYLERYGTPPIEYTSQMLGYKSNYLGVLRGGMLWNSWDADTVNDDYFEAALNKFFTNSGAREVATDQPEWLYFFNKTHNASLRLRVDVTFTDSTTASFNTTTVNNKVKGIYRFGAGYTQLNIPANVSIPSGQKVKSYTVTVNDGSLTDLSETYSFKIYNGAAGAIYVVFENMWGGFDTLRCTGEPIYGMDSESIDAVGVDDPDYTAMEGPIGQYNAQGRDTLLLNTGFLTQTQLEWIKELGNSEVVYLVEGSELVKCTIDRQSFSQLYGRQMPLNGISFGLKKANWR